MKLAWKLMLALMLGTLPLFGVYGYIEVTDNLERFRTDMDLNARMIGRELAKALADSWATRGEKRSREILRRMNEAGQRLRIRLVWLDSQAAESSRPYAPSGQLAPVLRGEVVSCTGKGPQGDDTLFVYVPFRVDSQRPGALELYQTLRPLREYTTRAFLRMFLLQSSGASMSRSRVGSLPFL